MQAETLRRFFIGEAAAKELAAELPTAWIDQPNGKKQFSCVELEHAFRVEASHLVRVCDAVLAGHLAPELLQTVGACLLGTIASWTWDERDREDRAAQVAQAWEGPEINYRLTLGTAAKFRHLLRTGESTFTPDDRSPLPVSSPV